MYTNLVCIESVTSDVESASNLTKPLQRRGTAQEESSDLVAGRYIDCAPLSMYTNPVYTSIHCMYMLLDKKMTCINGLESLPKPEKFQGNRHKGTCTIHFTNVHYA